MEFKIGDRVKFIGNYKEHLSKCGGTGLTLKELVEKYNNVFKISSCITSLCSKSFYTVEEDDFWCFNPDELVLASGISGITLLQDIKEGKVKNCDVKVYKNNKYQFTIQVGEKAILDNPKHHIGMLTSDKYTYEPVYKKEMTIAEIEKELGYSIKIIKD